MGIIPVVMGLFGISEVLIMLEEKYRPQELAAKKVKGLLPTFQDWMGRNRPKNA